MKRMTYVSKTKTKAPALLYCHFTFHISLFTFHYLHFTIHYSLFTFHYSLFTFHYSHFTFHTSHHLYVFHLGHFGEMGQELGHIDTHITALHGESERLAVVAVFEVEHTGL